MLLKRLGYVFVCCLVATAIVFGVEKVHDAVTNKVPIPEPFRQQVVELRDRHNAIIVEQSDLQRKISQLQAEDQANMQKVNVYVGQAAQQLGIKASGYSLDTLELEKAK